MIGAAMVAMAAAPVIGQTKTEAKTTAPKGKALRAK
jgi:hypothetical protein